jgi:ACT domain-containing protein
MRAVITVIGKDAIGIIAEVSTVLKKRGINIVDITQSVISDLFAMVMLVDISKSNVDFSVLSDELKALGRSLNLVIHVMHEDIFNSMHRI